MQGGGLSLQISEVQSKVMMEQFLIDAKIKAVGVLDISLNNEIYSYVTITQATATPWDKATSLKPLSYAEMHLKIMDILLVYPTEAEEQEKIALMPNFEPMIFYADRFVIHAKLNVGADMALSGVLDSLDKRFLAATEVSVYPLFPAATSLPQEIPIVLLNRAKISHYHAAE